MMFSRIKLWFLLKVARKEEEKHITTDDEIKEEHRQFMKLAKDAKKQIKND